MVCALHASIFSQQYGFETVVGQTEWMEYFVNRMLFGSPTVLFVMVSGIFFLSPERNVTAPKIWKKNVLKMAGAYIFWSLLYALYRIYLINPVPDITAQFFMKEWIVEPYHLWYVPMIIGLYIIAPILRPITATYDTKLFKYIVILFMCALVVSTIYNWPALPYGEMFVIPIIDKTPMALICQYPFWMLFGWIAYTYRPIKPLRCLLYCIGAIVIIMGIWANVYNWIHAENLDVIATTQKFSILTFFKNTAIFYFILSAFREHAFSETGKKWLRKLSDSTLIIYLAHMMFIYFMYDNNFLYGSMNLSPWVGVWIYAVIAYICGFIVAQIFHFVWDPIKPKKRSR